MRRAGPLPLDLLGKVCQNGTHSKISPNPENATMALIKFGAMVGQASGKLGSHVFSHNRGGPYIRLGTKPILVTSPAAQAVKNALAKAAQGWGQITAAQRNAWQEWAQYNPIINRLGEPKILSGQAAFVQLNATLQRYALSALTVPPIASAPAALLTLTGTFDIGVGNFEIAYTATPLSSGNSLLVEVAVVDNPGVEYVRNRYKEVMKSPAAQASPLDIETETTDRWGTLIVGQRVFVRCRVLDEGTGLKSAPLETNGTIVST